jgi:Tfp pilus assembly protein PilF
MTMDGRLKRFLAGSLLCGLVGCSHFRDNTPKPIPTNEPPLVMTDRPIVEERRSKNEPIKIDTLIAVGTVRVQAAADENRSSQDREELANQARLAYNQVLAREPKHLDALRGMARMYAVLRDKDKCVEWYQKATKAHPKSAEVWCEMGKALGSHFKDKDGMINCLHMAAKLAPENRSYRNELGFSLAFAGRYDEGFAWLSRTMPEAKARYNLAGIAEHNGQPEQAKIQLALAIKADPMHAQSKAMLAALSGVRMQPTESPIQAARHEQIAPAPIEPSPTIPIDPHMSSRKSTPAPTPKESTPANAGPQKPVRPPFMW